MSGVAPKPAEQRRNRHKPVVEWREVPNVPFEEHPELPALPRRHHEYRTFPRSWPAMTRRWWDAVASLPHCRDWTAADWAFAYDTALLAASFHHGDLALAGELRRREVAMGTTEDARRALRIRYVDAPAPARADPAVTAMADYVRKVT